MCFFEGYLKVLLPPSGYKMTLQAISIHIMISHSFLYNCVILSPPPIWKDNSLNGAKKVKSPLLHI